MKIIITSVLVPDQEKALQFYTNILGFIKKTDVPAGGARWLTVVSADAPDGVELLLEPLGFDFAVAWQKELYNRGIPLTMFGVTDVDAEYARLKDLGVVFRGEPKQEGQVKYVIFEDTCGNLIQIAQML
ncbi:VOC family protein [Chitinophaga sp. GCM10012297]|uniref:VOC family protein n=1 Tax=Chitinophaga chungangae TaxID=2821488 RepID=A0ABS3YH53_9BACT|nr:VOC family protein [Chitinophaga chungangae]MBO9154022.1 VOC family protein [Chitinophaga chungangae]